MTLSPDLPALNEVETPALVVDAVALQANIARMAEAANAAGAGLRPHAKSHKCAEIAARQLAAGAVGIACATLTEAEALAAAGIGGLLLTAPFMGEAKSARAVRLNREFDVTLVVDHELQVEALRGALRPGDPGLRVAVDVDVGHGRTGVTDPAEVVRLARLIAASEGIEFAGVQGYAGHAQHVPGPAERRRAAAASAARLQAAIEALAADGHSPGLVTGSGTGTFALDAGHVYTELQAGSYVFMDADYARILDERGNGPAFDVSLFVLATVVSVNRPGEVTVDAGTKALATNGPPPHVILGAPAGSAYRFTGDEHGAVDLPDGATPPALGARVLLSATHCDPTVNLHPCLHAVREAGLERWPVVGRYGD